MQTMTINQLNFAEYQREHLRDHAITIKRTCSGIQLSGTYATLLDIKNKLKLNTQLQKV